MKNGILAAVLVAPLSACMTTSFAPPRVNTYGKAASVEAATCNGQSVAASTAVELPRTVAGATSLTDNFILAYRCAERELANGRQFFQIPAFLAAAAGLVGPTFGFSNDAVLASGVGASVFNTGHSYYAPRAKAGHVSSALRAILCIKTEAVGISYFKADAAVASAAAVEGGSVYIDAEQQYFEMVSAALLSVESILAERLRDAGSADTTEMFAKLKELVDQHADAEKKLEEERKKLEEDRKKAAEAGGANVIGSFAVVEQKKELLKLENAVLQPRLQTCVLQARS